MKCFSTEMLELMNYYYTVYANGSLILTVNAVVGAL